MAQNWAWVQSANAKGSTTATTIAKAYGSAVTAGNCLAAMASYGDAVGAASFSDSVNGSWTATVKTVNDAGNGQTISVSHFPNTAAGTPTVTATFTSSGHRIINISEYSGIVTSAALDTSAGQKTAATTDPATNATGSVSAADDLVFAGIQDSSNGTAVFTGVGNGSADLTIHGGTTGQDQSQDANDTAACGDKDGPASGTTTATFHASASAAYIIACICLKQTTGGGGSTVKQLAALGAG